MGSESEDHVQQQGDLKKWGEGGFRPLSPLPLIYTLAAKMHTLIAITLGILQSLQVHS